MSKYFDEIEFDDPKVKEKIKSVDPTFNAELLALALTAVKDEILRLGTGASEYVNHAIHFGPYGCPAQNGLKTFEREPNWVNFKTFIELAKQDFSALASAAMKEMLLEAVEK